MREGIRRVWVMIKSQWKMKQINRAQAEVGKEIVGMSAGRYGFGLAPPGFAFGYQSALSDVMLLLKDGHPCCQPHYWKFMDGDTRLTLEGKKRPRLRG